MRPIRTAPGRTRAACLVYEGAHGPPIIHLSGDQNFQIVGQRDESAIKHPMGSARERYSVSHNIGPAFLDGTDMRGSDFRTTNTVNKTEPCDGATLVIST